jgi:hypothetical protein
MREKRSEPCIRVPTSLKTRPIISRARILLIRLIVNVALLKIERDPMEAKLELIFRNVFRSWPVYFVSGYRSTFFYVFS